MEAPIITTEVATRIERALSRASESRITHVQQLDGNPLGIEIRRWGHVTGTMVRRGVWYYPFFNSLTGLGVGDEGILDEALAWYRANQIRCRVSISPFRADEHLLSHLAQRGLRVAQFMTVLFGAPERDQPPPSADVSVRSLETSELDDFLASWLLGAQDQDRADLHTIVRAEFADWRCYVADYQGQVAATAAMRVADGVGVLAAGATRPEYRVHGCQTALLRQRISDAYAAGCDLVLSQATPGTVSQRNMERVGFRTAYTQAILV